MATQYSVTDPHGGTVHPISGEAFTTFVQRIDAPEEAAWSGVAEGAFADITVQHAPNALAVYSADDLARFGITATTVADPAPPAPPRAQLPKSVVIERLISANLIGQAMSALMASPADFGRWTAPDAPNVYCDDPDAIAMLTSIGADVSLIMAPAV